MCQHLFAPVLALIPKHRRGRGGGRRQVTNDPMVEVVGQHPLTHGNEQPEGLLLLGIEQQNGGQDVHGLHRFTEEGVVSITPRCATEDMKNHTSPKGPQKSRLPMRRSI